MELQTPNAQISLHIPHPQYILAPIYFFMFDDRKFSWGSALVGAAVASTATALVISSRPRHPSSHLISIDLTSFKLNFPALDAEMNLTVNVTNPNLTPICYSNTEMSAFHSGSHLGSLAPVQPQTPRSSQLLRLPVIRLSGTQLAHVAKKFVAEVGRRKMVLNSTLSVSGAAKVMWWNQKFKVHVDSHVNMDPFSLGVVDQENKSKLKILVNS